MLFRSVSQSRYQGYITKPLQNFKVLQGQTLEQDLINISKLMPDTKQEDLLKSIPKITTSTTTRQGLAGLYSMLVSKGLKESELEQLKFKITTKQKLITDIPEPTKGKPPRIKITTTRQPPAKITIQPKPKQTVRIRPPKAGKLYFRWNVNELSPGQYLPTKELTTGKTTKAITKVERIQRKQSKLIIVAFSEVQERIKELIDWWFEGNGEWAQA